MRHVVLLLIASAGTARADFGMAGTKVIEGRSNLRASATDQGSFDKKLLRLDVGGGYFVVDRISLGARVLLEYDPGEYGDNTAGLVLGGGFAIPVGERAFLWPQVGFAATRFSYDKRLEHIAAGPQVQVPLYIQPVDHLLIGGGPVLTADIFARVFDQGVRQDSHNRVVFELVGSVAGWW